MATPNESSQGCTIVLSVRAPPAALAATAAIGDISRSRWPRHRAVEADHPSSTVVRANTCARGCVESGMRVRSHSPPQFEGSFTDGPRSRGSDELDSLGNNWAAPRSPGLAPVDHRLLPTGELTNAQSRCVAGVDVTPTQARQMAEQPANMSVTHCQVLMRRKYR
jgi:hypothetical protein